MLLLVGPFCCNLLSRLSLRDLFVTDEGVLIIVTAVQVFNEATRVHALQMRQAAQELRIIHPHPCLGDHPPDVPQLLNREEVVVAEGVVVEGWIQWSPAPLKQVPSKIIDLHMTWAFCDILHETGDQKQDLYNSADIQTEMDDTAQWKSW